MAEVDAGYDGQDKGDTSGVVTFELERVKYLFTAQGTACRLIRDGIAVGVFYLGSEDEFKWLKERIEGVFEPEIYQVKITGESP